MMEETPVFVARKFVPSRCPNCEEPFSSPSSFSEYAGGVGASFAEAKAKFARLSPGLYGSYRDDGSEVQYTNRFDADFIACSKCENVTLRFGQEARRVMSRGEAERLVEEEGFVFWSEGTVAGNMAASASQLSFLGRTDPERPAEN